MEDKFILGGKEFNSRFILGSGKYSVELIDAAVKNAECEMITVALRRANTKDVANILNYIPKKTCYNYSKYFRSKKCWWGN